MSNGEELLRDERGRLSLYESIESAMCDPEDPAIVPTRRSSGLSPSSASAIVVDPVTNEEVVLGTCMRKTYYRMMGYPEEPSPPDPVGARKRQAGDLISEAYVYEPLKRAGVWLADELRFFDPDNLLSGRLDAMALIPGTLEKIGVEVKSMSPYMDTPFVKGTGRGFTRMEPRYKDLPQVMSYMQWWLQFGVKYWSIYYCTRDMQTSMYCFEWVNVKDTDSRPPDEAYLKCHTPERSYELPWLTWGQIRVRFEALRMALREKTVPPRDFMIQYPNSYLMRISEYANVGSQLVSVSKTLGKKIKSRNRAEKKKTKENDPDKHPVYVEKGDFECAYCPYAKRCWSGLGGNATPEIDLKDPSKDVPVAEVAERVESIKEGELSL